MTHLYLIRHAEQLSWAAERDQPVAVAEDRLTARGLEQARRLAERIARSIKIEVLYASPLLRAQQTAAAIQAATQLPVQFNDELVEIKLNVAKSLTEAENEQIWLRGRSDIHTPALPGSETFADFHDRVARTIESIALAHPEQSIAIVTHGGVIEQSFFHFLGIPVERNLKSFIQIDHTAIYQWQSFQYKQLSGWQLIKANDTQHLDGAG